jgi:hypothetical protein
MQPVLMQIERLEKVVDSLHNKSESILGPSDLITKDALRILIYLQGLKFDIDNLVKIEESMEIKEE